MTLTHMDRETPNAAKKIIDTETSKVAFVQDLVKLFKDHITKSLVTELIKTL